MDTNLFFPIKSSARVFEVNTVSREISIKQIDELIRMCVKLKLKFYFVGEGIEFDSLLENNNATGAPAHFHGPASQIELPNLYRDAKVFALNSSFEAGTRYALLEARACGLPTISNENTGSEVVIIHGIDGFLCGKGSGVSLDFALEAALRLAGTREFDLNSLFQNTVEN